MAERTAIALSFVAMLFYASEIVITDLKLGNVSPSVLTVLYSGGVALIGIAWLIINSGRSKEPLIYPSGKEWIFVGLMIAVSFVAASTHFAALHKHTGAAVMCIFYSLLPVTASILIFIFSNREPPSWKMIIAWVLAGIAVYLVASDKKP